MDKSFKLPPRMLFALDSPEGPKKDVAFNFDDIPKFEANKSDIEDAFFGFFRDSPENQTDDKDKKIPSPEPEKIQEKEVLTINASVSPKSQNNVQISSLSFPSIVPPIKPSAYLPSLQKPISKPTQTNNRPSSSNSKMPIFKPMSFQLKNDNSVEKSSTIKAPQMKSESATTSFSTPLQDNSLHNPSSQLELNVSKVDVQNNPKKEMQTSHFVDKEIIQHSQAAPPSDPKVATPLEAPKIIVPQGHDEFQTFFVDKTEKFHDSLANMTNYLEEAKEQLKELTVKLYSLNAETLFLVQPSSSLKEKFQRCEAVMKSS